MSEPPQPSGLVRSLSLVDVIMVGVASMIGGAIFVLVGPGMGAAGPALMLAFLMNGIITLFTALTYAELSSALPSTGGGYRWIREGLPRPNSYISGWMAWFAHSIAGSLYAVAFGAFIGHFLKTMEIVGDIGDFSLEKLFALIAIIIFTYVNIRGSSDTGKVGNAITLSQLAIITILITSGVLAMAFTNPDWSENFVDFFPAGTIGLVMAMGLTFIAFEGYEIIAQAGEEIKNPKRNIPRAILISLGIVVTLYIVFTFVFIGGLNSDEVGDVSWKFIGDRGELGIVEAAQYLLPFGAVIVLVGGLVSTLSALNATTFAASRVSFAMGRQYNLPHKFSEIHSKYRTPHLAITMSGIVMVILAVLLPLEQIAMAASVMFLFLFTQVNLSAISIRRLYGKKLEYGFKTPLFPLIPILGMLSAATLAVYLLIFNPLSWLVAIIWIIIGFFVYKLYTSRKELEHFAPLALKEGPEERKDYRVLILFNKKTAIKLAKIGTAIAKENEGEISFLNAVKVPRQVPLTMAQGFAEPAMKSFDQLKKSLQQSLRNRYLVRLTHDTTEAILATVEEQGINLLIMDFSILRRNRKLLSLTTCDILGIEIKKNFESELSQVVVSYDKGRHSDLGLEIANAMSKSLNSKIRIVRGVVELPEEEIKILSHINEKMFDLELEKIPFEKVYGRTEDITSSLLQNFKTQESEIIIVGSGNQADQAFSPKTIKLIDESQKSAFVVRNHLFSRMHPRSFWQIVAPRLKANRYLYRIYIELVHLAYFIKAKRERGRYDEEFFNTKV